IAKLQLTDAAVVDCTAADAIVQAYPDFVRANLHIITPNKRANVLPWGQYLSLMNLLQKQQVYFFDEANVGAGLPIMSTIRDLIENGNIGRSRPKSGSAEFDERIIFTAIFHLIG